MKRVLVRTQGLPILIPLSALLGHNSLFMKLIRSIYCCFDANLAQNVIKIHQLLLGNFFFLGGQNKFWGAIALPDPPWLQPCCKLIIQKR